MILRLALKDILHDWLLSICLVLAIASIIAPLLILFGLKFGTIQTLQSRLVQDPKNREIRPLTTKSYSRDWFDTLRKKHPEVSFIVPMTRQISTSITAINTAGDSSEQLSLMATATGDPLLLENGVTIPGHAACVLTEPAAQALHVSIGDELLFTTRRIIQGKYENGEFSVFVSGILEGRASSLKTAFVRLDIIEAVEDYKDGRAVPTYGWEGEMPTAYPVFDGAAVLIPAPLSKLEEVMLTNNTGFTQVNRIGREEAVAKLGYALPPEKTAYLVAVKQRAAMEESIQAVRNKLRGKGAIVAPWIEPLAISLASSPTSPPVALKLVAVTEGITTTDPSVWAQQMFEGADAHRQGVLIPSDSPLPEGEATLSLQFEDRALNVPVTLLKGGRTTSFAYASAVFAGRLNLLRYRNVKYDEKTNSLLLSRRGYAGFRMYTANIDDVENIQQALEREGITVHTEKERIGEVRRLDSYMGLIFWLIAAVGVVGGISALTASLYASVERKKKELNVLRLLGLLKREIVLFPIFQGLLLSGSALLLAGGIFLLVSRVINHLFSAHLRTAESLCALSPWHFMLLTAGVFVLSVFSATFAALQATRLDPAEALRDE